MLKKNNDKFSLFAYGLVILLLGSCNKDSNQEIMHAVINEAIEITKPEEALDGGKECIFVCEGGCILFNNHLFEDYKKNWSGINGITPEGKTMSLKICMKPECEGLQIHEIGPVSGKEGYVACKYEFMGGKPSIYRIFELDDEFCKIREIQARLTLNDLFEHIMEDTRGCFHITFWRENEFHTYVVISPEGETIFESDLGERPGEIRLCAFGEGRVAVSETIYNGNKIEHNFL